MCLERRPHLAVQVCIIGDHPGDHLPGQRVLREPAQVGHGHGKDDDKYGVQVGHDDNNDGDTDVVQVDHDDNKDGGKDGAAFEKEPDG